MQAKEQPVSKFIDLRDHQIKQLVEKLRPSVEIRKDLDIGYSFDGKDLILFEIRPKWNDRRVLIELPFAKGWYIKSKGIWKIYWKRANGWYPYDPHEVSNVKKFFDMVVEDKHGCFFG